MSVRRAALALLLAASSLVPAAPPFGAPAGAAGPAASPDFNGDGRSDLAIGAPGEPRGGAVHVLYGSVPGLRSSDDDWWHLDTAGMPGLREAGDEFGAATVAGDFDGDGYDDLAAGAPGEVVGRSREVGAVHVFAGSGGGVVRSGSLYLRKGRGGLPPQARSGERFGSALVGGDVDGDGFGTALATGGA